MSDLKVITRDSTYQRQGQLTGYASLSLVPTWNDVGAWELTAPADDALLADLTFLDGLIFEREDNGGTLLSGSIQSIKLTGNGSDAQMVVRGFSDTEILRARLARPAAYPYTADDYDTLTDDAETRLHHYVDANIGPSAPAGQRVNELSLGINSGRGTVKTTTARFENLFELLVKIATPDDLGFRVVQVGNGLEFQTFQAVDRSALVRFSQPLGNLTSYEYEVVRAEANYVVVGGGGEGTARTFAERGDNAAIASSRRREVFLDRRDTTDLTLLDEAITDELASKAERTSLKLSVTDTEAIKYGRDYNIGDRVRADLDDITVTDVVRNLTVTIQGGDESIAPLIGSPNAVDPKTTPTQRIVKQNDKRIGKLERQ